MTKVYLGMGSNLGKKKEYITQALELLNIHEQIEVKKVSAYYETEPVGYLDQDWFLNIAIEIETSLEPYSLLDYCQSIEENLGRKRLLRWGPRTIDIDILLYDKLSINEARLIVPHPRLTERAFVLIPLMEIAPNITINNQHIKELVGKLKEQKIHKI